MRLLQILRTGFPFLPGALMLAVALCFTGTTLGDRFPPDPVEELRSALKTIPEDFVRRDPALAKQVEGLKLDARFKLLNEARDKEIAKRVAALRNLGEMRRALLLDVWRPEEERDETAQTDRRNRASLINRFKTKGSVLT